MIAAGAFIVVSQFGIFVSQFGIFLLGSFLNIASIASLFTYIRARENRLLQAFVTFLLIPVFIIVFMVAATFFSEMFYGGSGYHGEYMFPFFRRTHY